MLRDMQIGTRAGTRSKKPPDDAVRQFADLDPATGGVLGYFPSGDSSTVDRAVSRARQASYRWRHFPAPRRAEILFRAGEIMVARKEDLARELTLEMGKVLEEARGDVQESIDLAYYFAGEGRRLHGITTPSESSRKLAYAIRVPVGVVGAITPFNFPLAIPALKVFPAIVAGNTVVLKPSSDTPRMANLLLETLLEAGLPPDVLTVVHGSGEEAGRRLVAHPGVDLISFTGSRAVGIDIVRRSAKSLKKTVLELGGKNPIIVLDDASIDQAVDGVLWSAFGTSGQRCTSASRVIAQRGIFPELRDRLVTATAGIRVGPGLDENSQVGPLINERAVARVERYVEMGQREGAQLLVGGTRLPGPGFFFAPTLFAGVRERSPLVTDEIFGPVLAMQQCSDLDDGLRLANRTDYGLSAAIYTENNASAFVAAEEIQTGLFYVNAGTIGAEAHLPSGGMKGSGNGHREASVAAIDSYTEWRSVYVDYSHKLQRAQIDIEALP